MGKELISEQTVLKAARKGEKVLCVGPEAIVTAAARDRAQVLGIRISTGAEPRPVEIPTTPPQFASGSRILAIGSDHGGYELKEKLKPFIESLGWRVIDLGTSSPDACDYPDFAYAVAKTVSLGKADMGIMIDSIGTASAMTANKVPGVRAACCLSEFVARSSREHNDANVLTLGGRVLGEELARSIAKAWLESQFSGGRHDARLGKIRDIEKRSSRDP
jgi:ribose 5-phosphate isomerase B